MSIWDFGLRLTNICERVFLVITWILFKITTLFFRFRPIPEPVHPLLKVSATELARRIRHKEVSYFSLECTKVYHAKNFQLFFNACEPSRSL